MLKPQLILATILSTAASVEGSSEAIANTTGLGSVSATSFDGSQSTHLVFRSEQQVTLVKQPDSTSAGTWVAVLGIGTALLVSLGIGVFLYKKNRRYKRKQGRKIDRFQEEFFCGPLASHYSQGSKKGSDAPSQETVSPRPNSQQEPSSPISQGNLSTPKDDEVLPSQNSHLNSETASPKPTFKSISLSDRYQSLIENIVATALKGQIRSKEYIYQSLVQNITTGTGEVFEGCLGERLKVTQSELNNLTDSQRLFQKETPELQKARLTRTLKALQSIQGEWERFEKHNRTQAAIKTAVQKIIAAPKNARLTVLLEIIDLNQNQVFNLSQLQQLARDLKAEGETIAVTDLKQEIQQLATGITRGIESSQELETYLVHWIYESTASRQLGLEHSPQRGQDPWALWAQKVSSPLPRILFDTLAKGLSVKELVAHQSYVDLRDWVEIAVLLQNLQAGLVAWFEKQPFDSKWGTAASISTFLSFAVVWCQLSNGFDYAASIDLGKREQLAKACFQMLLQILRAFAHQPYFPLYGGVFALFGGDYLRDTLNYLGTPLRQVERTQEKARVLTLLGYSQRILGNYSQSQSFHQQALEISRHAEDRSCEIANLNHLGCICVAQKNYSEAINYSQRALILSRQAGERVGEAYALATLGYGEVFSARQVERIEPDVYQRAIEYLKQGLKLSERLSEDPFSNGFVARHSQTLCYNSLGIAYLALEKPQTAIEYLEKGTAAALLSGDRYLQGLNFMYLAEAYYSLNNIEKVVCNSCLSMYILEQIAASEWRQSAGLLTIVRGQIGVNALRQLLAQYQASIIQVIGVDGFDYLPQLLDKYNQ